jgi:hypothetical protein
MSRTVPHMLFLLDHCVEPLLVYRGDTQCERMFLVGDPFGQAMVSSDGQVDRGGGIIVHARMGWGAWDRCRRRDGHPR